MAYTSTFGGLNTALRGLLAQQAAMDVTGHNIANINTEGYSRQRAELVQTAPRTVPAFNRTSPSQFGTGVEVRALERLRDGFIDGNLRNQFGNRSQAETLVNSFTQIEASFNELGENGVTKSMQAFFRALDKVAADPDSPAARQEFASASSRLATAFNQLGTDLTAIQNESNARLDGAVTDINSLSGRIAELNTAIRDAIGVGQQPNDLLDERDRLMDQLSEKVNYTYTTGADGQVTITLGVGGASTTNLVDPLAVGGWNAVNRGLGGAGDLDLAATNGDLTSGSVYADERLWATGGIIDGYIVRVDAMVSDFIAGINAAHANGFDLTGAAGGNIFDAGFISIVSGPPNNMRLDPANDISQNTDLIAASGVAIAGPNSNGDNALAMINLRYGVQAGIGATWENHFRATYAQVGTDSQSALQDLSNRSMLVETLEGRRAEVSGVSLDEEMSNMLRFQHAYGASARVMTAIDDSLDTLINRMGRVGL